MTTTENPGRKLLAVEAVSVLPGEAMIAYFLAATIVTDLAGFGGRGLRAKPFHHIRNACQWIAPITFKVRNGMRRRSRNKAASLSIVRRPTREATITGPSASLAESTTE